MDVIMKLVISPCLFGISLSYIIMVYYSYLLEYHTKTHKLHDILDNLSAVMFGLALFLIVGASLEHRYTFWGAFWLACGISLCVGHHWKEILFEMEKNSG